MLTCKRWQKALTTSLVFHIFLLAAAGFLAAHISAAPPVIEQIIELDLAPGLPSASPASGAPEPMSPPVSTPQSTPLPPAVNESIAVPAVTSDDTMSMTTEISPAAGTVGSSSSSSAPATGGNTVGNAGSGSSQRGGIAPPRILSKIEPEYPGSARQAGLEGTVILRVQILENGRPGFIAVFRSSGHEALDHAAVTAVQEWRFAPAKDLDSGRTVMCYTTLPVAFRLH